MSVAIRFPGTAGNYLSTDDTNILDADTAHLEQSEGLWTVGALSSDFATFGDKSLKVTGGASTAITPSTDAAYMGVYIYSVAGDTFDINGDTGVAVAAGEWTEVTPDTGTAGTYTVNAAGSADYYIGKAWLSATDAGFVPSLRIVGDLDYRIQMSLSDVTPASAMYLGSVWTAAGSQKSWHAYLTTSGAITCLWTEDGATNKSTGTAALGLPVADTSQEWRLVFDVDNGASGRTLSVYIDGVLDKSVTSATATSLFPAASFHSVGASGTTANLAADVYYTELRDGIGGPIVRRMDAADWIGTT